MQSTEVLDCEHSTAYAYILTGMHVLLVPCIWKRRSFQVAQTFTECHNRSAANNSYVHISESSCLYVPLCTFLNWPSCSLI